VKNYQDENIKAIESWIDKGWKWGRPFNHKQCEDIRHGDWPFLLTPLKRMPKEWIGQIEGKKILGLASGGGQQMVILAILGGECVLLDYSQKQIDSDLFVARREGYEIQTIKGNFTKPLPFEDGQFDTIVNPVSLVYAEKIEPIFQETYRVLKHGGIFVAGFDNGMNFVTDDEKQITNSFPVNPLLNPEQEKKFLAANDGYEFSHTVSEIIHGLLFAGFRIADCFEDFNEEGPLAKLKIPTFLAIRAIKD
jgi:ubiquinone/menaquinone biosynthesis C-methylase UbiE